MLQSNFIQPLQADSPLVQLIKNGNKQHLLKKHPIEFNDDHIMLCYLESGFIKRYLITREGNESVQSVYGPGEIFPLTPVYKAIFEQNIYYGSETMYYSAITESVIHYVNKQQLLEAINGNNLIYKDLLQVAGFRLFSNIHRLENTSLRASNKQVADLLCYYAERFGKETDTGIEIQLPLTHELIGAILNLARETVTHTLSTLEELDYIEPKRNMLIKNIEKLKKFSH